MKMVIDKIWAEMSSENLTHIDDIEKIILDYDTYLKIASEYRLLFDESKEIKLTELSDYFGTELELSKDSLINGYEILRTF